MAILAGDFLLARASSLAASLGADVAGLLAATIGELCRGQVLELQHLFDVDPHRGGLRVARSRARPPRCSRRRVASAGWWRTSTSPRSTRSPASATTSACASRSSTTCSTSPRPTRRSASPPARTCSRASTRCPVIYALARDRRELRDLLGAPDRPRAARRRARARHRATARSTAALDVAHDHAAKASEALDGADGLDPDGHRRARPPRRRPGRPARR